MKENVECSNGIHKEWFDIQWALVEVVKEIKDHKGLLYCWNEDQWKDSLFKKNLAACIADETHTIKT